ncbi:UDP-glucose 4-epimerase GalE [Exiguobacterium sp.]|uniref:UDP-glucose 4-epimerase GalE n=1 Tax=Exiguobacterium sp. TaxID=44751 RepID=UPI0028B05ECF|nr:UDP-glucose 4-epimerase GalE [Exiguobacterium sp.]
MKILITGGSGYIGSHTVYKAIEQGIEVVIIDDLITGNAKALHPDAIFYELDLKNFKSLNDVFKKHSFDQVIHFAARSIVSESITNPLKYFEDNIISTKNILECMRIYKVMNIVFSSTAAVYGIQDEMPLREDSKTNPNNAYGETKLAVEKMLKWSKKAYGINYTILRYFNAAGARSDSVIGEDHEPETHLIPLIMKVALNQKNYISIYGDDYETKDGTCIRDYIHVQDLADAHIKAVQNMSCKNNIEDTFNLGTGTGFTVIEVIKMVERITNKDIPIKYEKRREGDPAVLVASFEKVKKELSWSPEKSDLETIIVDAWKWHNSNPNGFN